MAARTSVQRLEKLKLIRDAWEDAYEDAITNIPSTGSKPDYSVGGQSVSWQAVYMNGPKVIEELTKRIIELEWSIGGVVDTWVTS